MANAHYFVAIPIADPAAAFLKTWSTKKAKEYPFKKWVHPEDYHITLAFLGGSSRERLESLSLALEEVVKAHVGFRLSLNGFGSFGNRMTPKVYWAAVSNSSALVHLQQAVAKTCAAHHFEMDQRPFTPHITLARRWRGSELEIDLLEKEKQISAGASANFAVNQVVLFQTHIDQTPMYEAIRMFSLEERSE